MYVSQQGLVLHKTSPFTLYCKTLFYLIHSLILKADLQTVWEEKDLREERRKFESESIGDLSHASPTTIVC